MIRKRLIERMDISILLIGVLLAIIPAGTQGRRAVSDESLAYPVLITLDNDKTASGFYHRDSNDVYFVTARHVLFDPSKNFLLRGDSATLLSYSSNPDDTGQNMIEIDLTAMNRAGNIRYHQTHDVAVIQIAQLVDTCEQRSLKVLPGVYVKEMVESGIFVTTRRNIKLFDDVLIANDVYVFGYPTSLGIRQTPQLDYTYPLLRKGIVAGKNVTQKSIIIDCPTYRGNSGGPVLELEQVTLGKFDLQIIGVISQFVPFVQPSVDTLG